MKLWKIRHPDVSPSGEKYFGHWYELRVAARKIKAKSIADRVKPADRVPIEIWEATAIAGRDAMVAMLNGKQTCIISERKVSPDDTSPTGQTLHTDGGDKPRGEVRDDEYV